MSSEHSSLSIDLDSIDRIECDKDKDAEDFTARIVLLSGQEITIEHDTIIEVSYPVLTIFMPIA